MEFKLTDEMKDKLKACKSPEELMELARENNLDISMEEIRDAVDGKDNSLSDEELDQAAGGCSVPDNNYCKDGPCSQRWER